MSVIAIQGIPAKFSLIEVVKHVSKQIAGSFEPLNFLPFKHGLKTCYIRLSERLDPSRVVERINSTTYGAKGLVFKAFVPEVVPDLPLLEKRKKIPMKLRDKLKIPELELPHEVIINTHHELFLEIQYKYPSLYNLSRKTGHKLLDEIARVIGERVKHVMSTHLETRESSFLTSKTYRRLHPHFGDFQLVLSTLHRLQDAAGAPRTQLQETDLLAATPAAQMIDKVPLDRLHAASNKFGDRVVAALEAHVAGLDSTLQQLDSEELIARKKVREELKKVMPFMPAALKQVILGQLIPEEQPYRRIRIYGEPFMPSREAMEPFTMRYTSKGKPRFIRSRRMYNLLMFRVLAREYAPLRAMDATVVGGAKLTIRGDQPVYEASEALRAELAAHYGGTPHPRPPADEDDDDDNDENDNDDADDE